METSVKRIAKSVLKKETSHVGGLIGVNLFFRNLALIATGFFLGRWIIKRHWIQEYLPANVFSTGRFRRLKTGGDG